MLKSQKFKKKKCQKQHENKTAVTAAEMRLKVIIIQTRQRVQFNQIGQHGQTYRQLSRHSNMKIAVTVCSLSSWYSPRRTERLFYADSWDQHRSLWSHTGKLLLPAANTRQPGHIAYEGSPPDCHFSSITKKKRAAIHVFFWQLTDTANRHWLCFGPQPEQQGKNETNALCCWQPLYCSRQGDM